ncbi:hypothetical protein X772_32325 [Mesorhizobium sp. LSJC280B00]|nr:hypothetical protein X772_32325 [Mesorhizobium sp. LSJC280B00]
MLSDEIDTVSQLNQLRNGPPGKTRIDFNDDWAKLRPSEFNVRWPPAEAERSQTAQPNLDDTFMLVTSERGRIDRLTTDEMRRGPVVNGTNPNDFISHYLRAIMGAVGEFLDQYPRRRLPYVLSAQKIRRMFGQLVDIAAQSDTAAAAANDWLKDHGQADLRGRTLYVLSILRHAISRHRNTRLREELTLSEFVAASFNRCGVRSW